MREIRFRGLRTDGKGWVYGNLIKIESGQCYIFNFHFIPSLSVASENFVEVVPESVGQFTGLLDKNGTEIYEDDICVHLGETATIVFWEGSFIFNKYYIHDYALTNFACCRTFEIIGNIHENPELLK